MNKHVETVGRLLQVGLVVVILLFVVMLFIGNRGASTPGPAETSPDAEAAEPADYDAITDTDVIYAGRHAITRALKAPDSATFPVAEDPSYSVAPTGPNRYRVRGTLKAQNSFGVMLRQTWAAEVEFLPGDEIKPLMLMLDGDVLYDAR